MLLILLTEKVACVVTYKTDVNKKDKNIFLLFLN